MKKGLPVRLFLLLLPALLTGSLTIAQTGGLNGVYAGIEVSLPTVMGQGMDRTDRVIYFRPDGSFNHNLRKADWKTAVTGRYTVAGNQVSLQFTGGGKETMTLEKDGDLQATGNTGSFGMLKMGTFNQVPPGQYKFSSVSGTGGGASGQVFVGSSANVGLYFDGKGHFARDAASATLVAGGNVGGGTSNKKNEAGAYTIQDGVLTLQYQDGRTEIHSFFCRPTEKPLMAAINGRIYFMEDKAAGDQPVPRPGGKASPGKEPVNEPRKEDARSQLYQANKVQGGTALDNLQRITVSAMVNGLTVVSTVDLARERIRIEMWQGNTLTGIEQLAGNEGWQWQNGKRSALSAARQRELKTGFVSGVLGLRKAVIDRMQNLQVKTGSDNTFSITGRIDGEDHLFLFNEKGELIGEASGRPGQSSVSRYGNLKPVNGILLPFAENLTVNGRTLSIQYNHYTINPALTDQDWAEK